MSDDAIKLSGFGTLVKKLKENNVDISEEELSSLFSQTLESSKDGKVSASEFSSTLAETYGIEDNSEILGIISQIASNDGVDDDLSTVDFEKQKEIEENANDSTFSSQLDENTSNALISVLEKLVASQEESLNATKENNGIIAGLWDGFKNLTGIGAGSSKVQAEIDKFKEEIEKVKNGELSLDEVYEDITGNALDENEFNALIDGSVDYSKSDFLQTASKYKQGQKQVVNTVSGIGSALTVTGLVVGGIFTGGLSWLAAGAICVGAGTAAYMVPQAVDGLTEKDGYSAMELAEDLAVGTVNSLIQTVTMGTAKGISGAIANKVTNQTAASLLSAEVTSLELGVGMATGDYLAEAGATRLDDLSLTEDDKTAYEQIAKGELKEGDEGYEEALERANKYYAAISNNSDLSLQGLTTTALTSTAASLAAGASVVGVQGTLGTTLANATMNSSATAQIGARLLTGGVSGATAGASATFVGGGTNYLLTTDGNEITLGDWLNSSTENLASGAITGLASGVAFEAVQIASGTPAPENAEKINKDKVDDNGLKYTEYLDKDGNVIAKDYKASDVSDFLARNNQEGLTNYSQETASAQNTSNNARTVRVTYDYQSKTAELNGTTYETDGVLAKAYQLDWYNNAIFLGQKGSLQTYEIPNGNTSLVVDEQGNVISENNSLLLENAATSNGSASLVVDEQGNIISENNSLLLENATVPNEEITLATVDNNGTQILAAQDNVQQMMQNPAAVKFAAAIDTETYTPTQTATTSTTTTPSALTPEGLETIVEQRLTDNKALEGLDPEQIQKTKTETIQAIEYVSDKFKDMGLNLSKEAIIEMMDAFGDWKDANSDIRSLAELEKGNNYSKYVLSKLVNSSIVDKKILEYIAMKQKTDSPMLTLNALLKCKILNEEQTFFAKDILMSLYEGLISDSDLKGVDWKNLSSEDETITAIVNSGEELSKALKYQNQLDYKKFLAEVPEGYKIRIQGL